MPAAVSGYASAAARSFGTAAFSFCVSVENVPFAPIPAAAGASPGFVSAFTGTTAVFRTTVACASSSVPFACSRLRYESNPNTAMPTTAMATTAHVSCRPRSSKNSRVAATSWATSFCLSCRRCLVFISLDLVGGWWLVVGGAHQPELRDSISGPKQAVFAAGLGPSVMARAPPALGTPGAPLRRVMPRWHSCRRFRDGAEARKQCCGVAVGDRGTFVPETRRQRTFLVGIDENDDVRRAHVEPERCHRCSRGHEYLADRPPLEFGYRACGDDWNPLALETLHQLLSSPIVVVDEDDRQARIGEQVPAARTSRFKDEVAITDGGHLQRSTLRTTVFHFTTSLFPNPLHTE